MKALTLTTSFILILSTVLLAAVKDPVEKWNHRNHCVIHADKEMLGATVKVTYSNGDVISLQKLVRRKMIIDFSDVKFGEYKIEVSKGDNTDVFHYLKK